MENISSDQNDNLLGDDNSDRIVNTDLSENQLNESQPEDQPNESLPEDQLNENQPEDMSDRIVNTDFSEDELNESQPEDQLNEDISDRIVNTDKFEEKLDDEEPEDQLNENVCNNKLNENISNNDLITNESDKLSKFELASRNNLNSNSPPQMEIPTNDQECSPAHQNFANSITECSTLTHATSEVDSELAALSSQDEVFDARVSEHSETGSVSDHSEEDAVESTAEDFEGSRDEAVYDGAEDIDDYGAADDNVEAVEASEYVTKETSIVTREVDEMVVDDDMYPFHETDGNDAQGTGGLDLESRSGHNSPSKTLIGENAQHVYIDEAVGENVVSDKSSEEDTEDMPKIKKETEKLDTHGKSPDNQEICSINNKEDAKEDKSTYNLVKVDDFNEVTSIRSIIIYLQNNHVIHFN